jgi:hypothetical protein
MSMLQRRRAGQQTTDETLDRLKFNVNGRLRSRSGVEEHLPLQELSQCLDSWKPEFVDWSSGRLLNLDDAMNMKQGRASMPSLPLKTSRRAKKVDGVQQMNLVTIPGP